MPPTKSYELAKVRDLHVGSEIHWNTKSKKHPGIIVSITPTSDACATICTTRGTRTLPLDDSVIVVRTTV